MRKTLTIGIGAGATAAAVALSAGVSLAASAAPARSAAGPAAAVTTVNKHITRAQAAKIATALVPHSTVREIESDDLHDRAVWKVQLSIPRGRVVVDVDKKTGKATIMRRDGGHGDLAAAVALTGHSNAALDRDVADDRWQNARDHDGGREHGDHRGDRHDRDRHDRDRHDRDRVDDRLG
jgi:peptidase YpeB-like protein